ncbi:MAG: response regulator [Lachnospiraceae bacterium]|nr:response regulator [Lachnospiraceae bacterium]
MAAQYATISVLFIEILVVLFRLKNPIHSYLLLACISSFISNMGYLFQMKALTEEAYLSALQLSYAGRVWIVLSLFLFTARLCGKKIPSWLTGFLVIVHVAIYLSVLTIGENSLFYTDISFVHDTVFPIFRHGNGSMHDLFMGLNSLSLSLALFWLVGDLGKEKNKKARSRILMLLLSFGVQAVFFVMQTTGMFEITYYYDLTMPGAFFGTVFILIGILGFDLLGTREIARDFVIDRISEGIIAVDNNGRIRYYNEPLAKLYPEFDYFYKADAEPLRSLLSKRFTPYDILAGIKDAVDRDDTIEIGDRIFTPEENELVYHGESYGKLYALVDDTDHYRYMEELSRQRDIADSANAAKSRFLANMSHEIRTPINAVLGMDEMILRESGEKNIRSYAADIMSAGRTLLSLINDILDFSKVEEGRMEIIPVQYDLSTVINDLINMTRDRAAKKGLEFTLEADEHIPRILYGDEIRIKQCAMNLLTNGVKYTEAGEVKAVISYEKKDEDHILLKFTVRDTGIGMKEEDMEDLFSPYKRIEEKRNRSIEGTGLGMSITRQLLELMGSELLVSSRYGKGSEFSFEIEQEVIKWEQLGDYCARAHEISEGTYRYHRLLCAPGARILVVDDTETNLTVIKSLLKRTQVGIDTAMSGKKAIELAKNGHYDLIFVDHMMPDMDGIETLRHIREGGESSKTPAVALTANAVSGARERYLEAGFDDYLSKPVDGMKLERMIRDMLPKEKLEDPERSEDDESKNQSFEEGRSAAEDARNSILNLTGGIKDLDPEAGINNCGSPEGYMSVLLVFHKTAPAKADEIEQFCKAGDLENYTVKVHALKSSARIIGASALSSLAQSLEEAGKSGDRDLIEKSTGSLLEMYRSLDGALSVLDKKDEEKPAIDDSALKEAYQTMAEIAGAMDYGMMEELLKELLCYSLPKADRARIARIEEMLTQLDWDGIAKTAGEGSLS